MLVQKLDLKDLQFEKMTKFDGTMAYSQTKRQEVIMTDMYAKQYPKVHFSVCHPGWADTAGMKFFRSHSLFALLLHVADKILKENDFAVLSIISWESDFARI